MRPSRTVARAALAAVLALGALPGLVGSRQTSPIPPADAALFEQVNLASTPDDGLGPFELDDAWLSAGVLRSADEFAETGSDGPPAVARRASPDVPAARTDWAWKTPKYTLTGTASFYDNGTTAMRIPRGTTIVICGGAGCIERVVNDYGPSEAGGRIIDMYRPDFFSICGCPWYSGTTTVEIRVY